jgi:hypothetical protein
VDVRSKESELEVYGFVEEGRDDSASVSDEEKGNESYLAEDNPMMTLLSQALLESGQQCTTGDGDRKAEGC